MNKEVSLPEFHILVVGDKRCGKTSLISQFGVHSVMHSDLGSEYIVRVTRPSAQFDFRFFEMSTKNWPAQREAVYAKRPIQAVLMCFAANSAVSFCSLSQLWIQEVAVRLPKCPVVVVALKSDLGSPQLWGRWEKLLDPETADLWASRLNIRFFVECSARTSSGIMAVLSRVLACRSFV